MLIVGVPKGWPLGRGQGLPCAGQNHLCSRPCTGHSPARQPSQGQLCKNIFKKVQKTHSSVSTNVREGERRGSPGARAEIALQPHGRPHAGAGLSQRTAAHREGHLLEQGKSVNRRGTVMVYCNTSIPQPLCAAQGWGEVGRRGVGNEGLKVSLGKEGWEKVLF